MTAGRRSEKGDGRERIYIVEPTGTFQDDPNLTDKRFPGNSTKSYRSRSPLQIVGAVIEWQRHPPERLEEMKQAIARITRAAARPGPSGDSLPACHAAARQNQAERRDVVRRVHLQFAAVGLRDRLRDEQAKAKPIATAAVAAP